MPRNYRPTSLCNRVGGCGVADHYLTVREGLVVWRTTGGIVYAGYRDSRYTHDIEVGRAQSTKDLHAMLRDKDFIVRVLLVFEET